MATITASGSSDAVRWLYPSSLPNLKENCVLSFHNYYHQQLISSQQLGYSDQLPDNAVVLDSSGLRIRQANWRNQQAEKNLYRHPSQ